MAAAWWDPADFGDFTKKKFVHHQNFVKAFYMCFICVLYVFYMCFIDLGTAEPPDIWPAKDGFGGSGDQKLLLLFISIFGVREFIKNAGDFHF